MFACTGRCHVLGPVPLKRLRGAFQLCTRGQACLVSTLTRASRGAIVNPDGLDHQVSGAVVQGLGGALFEALEFRDGALVNGTMEQYRVPRFKDVPPIEVVLLDRRDLPSAGAGETPIVCVAPAIGSAARAFGAVDTALPVRLVD